MARSLEEYNDSRNLTIVTFKPGTCHARAWNLSRSILELIKLKPRTCQVRAWSLTSLSLVVAFARVVLQVRCFRKSSPNASHRRISTRRVSHAQSDNRTPAAPFVVNPRFLRARALFLTSPCFVRVVRCLPVCRKPHFFLGHSRFLTRPVSDK